MGDVVAAVDRYQDMPAPLRERLKQRMRERRYDEIVSIRRDSVSGRAAYDSEITDMHFGSGSVCKTVSRSQWAPQAEERGLVYCEEQQCILVPTVCRNVSRIKRRPAAVAPARVAEAAASTRELEADPQAELEMDPPSAGPLASVEPPSEHRSFAQAAGQPPSHGGGLLGGGAPQGGSPEGGGHYGGGPAWGPTAGGPTNPPYLPPGTLEPKPLPGRPPADLAPPSMPAVPEPSSWLLLLAGIAGALLLKRCRGSR